MDVKSLYQEKDEWLAVFMSDILYHLQLSVKPQPAVLRLFSAGDITYLGFQVLPGLKNKPQNNCSGFIFILQ